MIKRNPHLSQLKKQYLFPEITARKEAFLSKNPGAQLISLGIGDTTQPLTPHITNALKNASEAMGTPGGYSGYGPEQGNMALRQQIASRLYGNAFQPHEVFISDGANSDIARLQVLFGNKVSIAVQDPTYPVYVEGSLINGVETVVLMPCLPENQFFPDLKTIPRTDLIYFCSPNNPTGTAANREQLTELVQFARRNGSIILYDSVYVDYCRDPSIPRTLYEIEGAREVTIEIGSFSKQAGFTGVRLGWTIVPEELKYSGGQSIRADWDRLVCTLFNGASNIVQKGGMAVLEEAGQIEVRHLTDYYLENARLMREAFDRLGYEYYGGVNSPYLWTRFRGRNSWEIFQEFLEKYHLLCVPGVGFGPSGEGFVRFTAFGQRERILVALGRLDS